MENRIREAKDSQSAEFMRLLTGAQSRLYTYVCSLIGDAAGAHDIVQETNIALWNKSDEYDPARPFLPWAYQVARFQVMAYLKRCRRSRLVFDEYLINEITEEILRNDDDHASQLEALAECVEKLPGSKRELLDRRYLRGEAVEDIARELHKPPNVVSATLYRVRKLLLNCIESRLNLRMDGPDE